MSGIRINVEDVSADGHGDLDRDVSPSRIMFIVVPFRRRIFEFL